MSCTQLFVLPKVKASSVRIFDVPRGVLPEKPAAIDTMSWTVRKRKRVPKHGKVIVTVDSHDSLCAKELVGTDCRFMVCLSESDEPPIVKRGKLVTPKTRTSIAWDGNLCKALPDGLLISRTSEIAFRAFVPK